MNNKKVKIVIIGLGARGHDIYGEYLNGCKDKAEIVAIADPNETRLARAALEWGISADMCFSSAEQLLSQPCMADAALICTQDKQHVPHALAALEKGYHLLLEKPVATSIEGCNELLACALKYNRFVVVCHVLRYTNFYRTIYNLINDGSLGKVCGIQAMEHVGYWHFAHSFVRGNWRNSNETSPMILAKCCHDMDILLWLAGKRAKAVSSYGTLNLFKAENAPKGAAKRCIDCPVRHECPYDAVSYYLESKTSGVNGGFVQWPINVLALEPTPEKITAALKEGAYGRCVYACDNNVVDHQVVNINLEDGVTINFTATAFTDKCSRSIKVMGSLGYLEGNMEDNTIIFTPFGKPAQEIKVEVKQGSFAGHGGGDAVMVAELIELLQSESQQPSTGIEQSVESHLVALLAEQSRLNGGESISIT